MIRVRLRALADDLDEVFRSFGSRRGRTAMLVLAVALSVGVTVASLGIGRTAAQQIAGDLAAQIHDEVSLSVSSGASAPGQLFGADAESRARTVAMVRTAGLRVDVDPQRATVSRFDRSGPAVERGPGVVAVSAGYLEGAGIENPTRWAFSAPRTQAVALVGRGAAERLALPATIESSGYTIRVAGRPTQVIGTISTPDGALDELVMIPYATGVELMGGDATARLVVTVASGAGARVATALPAAVRPDAPARLTASRVADLAALRAGVDTQLGRLTGMLGVVLTAITALLIGNATAAAVTARTAEIGLRRALGGSSGSVVRLFLAEGIVVGLVGGTLGAAIGGWLVVLVAHGYGWTARMSVDLAVLGVGLGLATGVVASVYPSARAARIHPAQAVRVE